MQVLRLVASRISLKIAVSSVITNMIMLTLCFWVSYRDDYAHVRDKAVDIITAIGTTLVRQIDGDAHERLATRFAGIDDINPDDYPEEFGHAVEPLRYARIMNRLTSDIYTLRISDEMRKEIEQDPDRVHPEGTRFILMSGESPYYRHTYDYKPEMKRAFFDGEVVTTRPYKDKYGDWISVYVPIRDSAGRTVAVLDVDWCMNELYAETRALLHRSLAVLLLFAFFSTLVLYAVARGTTRPLARLTREAERFARGDYETPIQTSARDEVGQLARVLDRARTERQQAEQEYLRLASFPENNPNPVLESDAAGRIMYANRAADGMMRRVEMGRLRDLLPWDHKRRVAEAIDTGLTSEVEDESVGNHVIAWTYHPLANLGLVHIHGFDVTQRRIAQDEKRALEHQLYEAQKLESVGQLAAGIAHEINTPMQYLGDNTRFLRDGFRDVERLLGEYRKLAAAAKENRVFEDLVSNVERLSDDVDVDFIREETGKAIEQSLEGVERVSKIVRAMKEFSHPGGDEKKPTDINRAVETTVTVARNEWKYVAEVEMDLDDNLPEVPCLPGALNQALLNIVVNAAHAIGDVISKGSAGKGTIHVKTRADGDFVEVRIHDTGTGIPESDRERIFDLFYTTKEVGKGTGQGLTIAHAVVVQKHGGTLEFETEVGKGTTFIIRLPLEPSVAPQPESPAPVEG